MVAGRLAVLVSCLALTGCFSSVRVQRSTSLAAEPKGIPFYTKTSVCKQQTVWLEPQYILTYDVEESGKISAGPIEKVLSRKEYLQQTVQEFIANPSDVGGWTTNIFSLPGPSSINESAPDQIKKEEADGNWIRASNTGTVEVVVDYGNVFYLNSARPLAGSTQVSAKLASDGTLTDVSAQLQDQTLQTIASTISSLIGSASTVGKLVGFVEAKVQFKVNVKTRVYAHTHSQYPDNLSNPADTVTCIADPSGVYGGSFIVAELPDPSTAKPATADKQNTISVSGSIVLPKASAPSAPAPTTPPSAPPKQP